MKEKRESECSRDPDETVTLYNKGILTNHSLTLVNDFIWCAIATKVTLTITKTELHYVTRFSYSNMSTIILVNMNTTSTHEHH